VIKRPKSSVVVEMKSVFKDERNTWDRIRIKKLERLHNLLKLESDIEL